MPSDKAMREAEGRWIGSASTCYRSYAIEQVATALDERDAQLAEQARAFSDVARAAAQSIVSDNGRWKLLSPFIIPEPEPDVLAQALSMILTGANNAQTVHDAADKLRAEIAHRGGITILGDAT